jgi:hypothetical protein
MDGHDGGATIDKQTKLLLDAAHVYVDAAITTG